MPEPIIAGAAAAGERLAATRVTTTTRPAPLRRAQRQQPDIARQRQIRQTMTGADDATIRGILQHELQQRALIKKQKDRTLTQKVMATLRKLRAATTAAGIGIFLVWIYAAQALGAIMFFVGYEIEQGFFTRNTARIFYTSGEQFAMYGWILAAAAGVFAMLLVATSFSATLIRLNRTPIILFGIFAFAAHLAPYLFIVPWFAIWIVVIIWNQ